MSLILGITATAETIKRLMGRRLPAVLGLVYWLLLAFAGVHLLGLAAAQFPDVPTDQWRQPWHPFALAALVWVAIVTVLVITAKVIAAPMAWHIRRVTPNGEDAGESLEDFLWPYRSVEGSARLHRHTAPSGLGLATMAQRDGETHSGRAGQD